MEEPNQYWFRPKRFWGVFAFYYPSSLPGIFVTSFLIAVLIGIYFLVREITTSYLYTALFVLPWFIACGAIFDMLCFRFGEYPSWWNKKVKRF